MVSEQYVPRVGADLSDLLNAAAVVSATSSSGDQTLVPSPYYFQPHFHYPNLSDMQYIHPPPTIPTPPPQPISQPPPSISTGAITKSRRRCEGVDKVCNMDAVPGRRFCRVCQKRSTNKMREQHIQSLEDQLRAASISIAQLSAQQRALRSFQIMAKRLRFSSLQPPLSKDKDAVNDEILCEVHSFLKLFSSYSAYDNSTCATPQPLIMQQTRHPTDALVALLNLGCESKPLSPVSSPTASETHPSL